MYNQVEDSGKRYKETDLAYAAGVIDSDGCISLTRWRANYNKSTKYKLQVVVQMTTPEVTRYLNCIFFDEFGGHYRQHPRREANRAPVYCWSLSCRNSAGFLRLILPYLRGKADQAKLAIEYCEAVQRQPTPGRAKYPAEFENYRRSTWETMRALKRKA